VFDLIDSIQEHIGYLPKEDFNKIKFTAKLSIREHKPAFAARCKQVYSSLPPLIVKSKFGYRSLLLYLIAHSTA
jgi:hypothetical protein